VDVPVVETGAAATLQLAQEILAALPKAQQQQFTIVSCAEDGGAVGSGRGGVAPVVTLQQVVADGTDLDGCLLIAGATATQVCRLLALLCIAAYCVRKH
jgi:hypothetical protein